MTSKKQAWRITGLWSKQLPSGGTVLSAKVPLAAILDAVENARAAGLHEVDVEVWEAWEQSDRKPTHTLRIAEPFQKAGNAPAASAQAQPESYPF
jgi:hypothetical protein